MSSNTKSTTYQRCRKALADNLLALAADSSVNALAASIKVPQRSLENLTEVGTDPRLSTICAVAEALGKQPWELLLNVSPDDATRRVIWELARDFEYAGPVTKRLLEFAKIEAAKDREKAMERRERK